MSDVREETTILLDERANLESDLREVLAVDAERDTWTFDDISLDSGTFGELVSRDIVEKVNGEYRLADRDAVRAALNEDAVTEDSTITPDIDLSISLPPWRVLAALTGTLILVAVFRLFAYPSVFRDAHVVFLGNDPYFYRYWLYRFAIENTGVLSLPDAVEVGEPLLFATLWGATTLLGGTTAIAFHILAWYPVVAGVITAWLCYLVATKLTADRRIGLASVAILAVTPVHAYRTSIGFGDHHAFDYLWLALTVLAAVVLLQRENGTPVSGAFSDPKTLVWTGVLGLGVAGQVLAWNAGPVLLLPLAAYGVVRAVAGAETDRSPLVDLPLVAGIGLGAMLALLVNATLSWQRLYIVVTPLLLAIGLGVLLGAGEAARRRDLSGLVTLGALVGLGSGFFVVAYLALPSFAAQFTQEVTRLFVGGQAQRIAETASLFSPRFGLIAAPFFFFGLALFFALPYVIWGLLVGWRRERPAWLLVSAYGALLFALALLQVRFAGHLALLVAIFGGLAVVHLVAITTESERPAVLAETSETRKPWQGMDDESSAAFEIPERQTVMAIVVVFLLVGGLGTVMTPVRTSLLTVNDETYHAATTMAEYAAHQEWEYPQNYVFSEWGEVRMYNALVNNHSASYRYAQANYADFLSSTNGDRWYRKLRDRAGFVVVPQLPNNTRLSKASLYHRLHAEWGSGTGHYRAIWASSDGSKKVFTLVPGAIITGPGKPNSTVTLQRTVEIAGHSFTYERTAQVNRFGVYVTRVPYTGQYALAGRTANVTETAVTQGRVVATFSGPGVGYWSFDEGTGDVAYDRVGGHHASLHNASWTASGVNGSALRLDGNGYAQANLSAPDADRFTISVWVKPSRLDTTSENDFRHIVAGQNGSLLVVEENGAITFRVPGVTSEFWAVGDVPTDEWSHVVAVYNGTHRILYVNGQRVGSQRIGKGNVDWGQWLRFGAQGTTTQPHGFAGGIDEIRVYGRSLNISEIRKLNESGHTG